MIPRGARLMILEENEFTELDCIGLYLVKQDFAPGEVCMTPNEYLFEALEEQGVIVQVDAWVIKQEGDQYDWYEERRKRWANK